MLLILLFSSVAFADDVFLSNGYVIKNVQFVDSLDGVIRYRGLDIVISLTRDQIWGRVFDSYDPSMPCRFIISNKEAYRDFYISHYTKLDTASQISITTVHGETIRGDLHQKRDSGAIFKTDYGLIIVKNLVLNDNYIIEHPDTLLGLNIELYNGKSFDGEQISLSDSSVTYKTISGDLIVPKGQIKGVHNVVSGGRTFFLGDTIAVTTTSDQSFEGVLIASTASTETFRTNSVTLSVPKRNIRGYILIGCGATFENQYLHFGNTFKVAMRDQTIIEGKLISSADSTLTFQTADQNITVLKEKILTVMDISFVDKYPVTNNPDIVVLRNKVSFRGELILSTDSIALYLTDVGNVAILKKNIIATAGTVSGAAFNIYDAGVILPSLLIVYGGFVIPTGQFANTSIGGGGAQLGYSAGLQFVTSTRIGFLLDIGFSSNSMNKEIMRDVLGDNLQHKYGVGNISVNNPMPGDWANILLLGGLKIGTKNKDKANYFIAPVIGMGFSILPKISSEFSGRYYSSNSEGLVVNNFTGRITQTSSTSGTLLFGVVAEVMVLNGFMISTRYILGNANYRLVYSDGSDNSIRRLLSVFQVGIGAKL